VQNHFVDIFADNECSIVLGIFLLARRLLA